MFKVRTLIKAVKNSEAAYVIPELAEIVYVQETNSVYIGDGVNTISNLNPIASGRSGSYFVEEIDGGNAFDSTQIELSGGNAFDTSSIEVSGGDAFTNTSFEVSGGNAFG